MAFNHALDEADAAEARVALEKLLPQTFEVCDILSLLPALTNVFSSGLAFATVLCNSLL